MSSTKRCRWWRDRPPCRRSSEETAPVLLRRRRQRRMVAHRPFGIGMDLSRTYAKEREMCIYND